MRASRLRVLAAALALGFVLAIVAGAAGLLGGSRAFAGGTTITIIGGEVAVRHGASDFVAAADGETLNAGDAIRTGADGRAILTYFEGSTVTVEPNTQLAIDRAAVAPDGGTVVLMTQAAGRTWHVVTKLITGGSKYEVRTPASTASVRGTEFQVDASDDVTTVTTTEGTVVQHVPDPARPNTTVDVPVTAGTTQTQRRDALPAPTKVAPQPDRRVTVTVGAANTLVIDALGRANGLTRDGKLVVQTPGAQVRREGDRIVVTLPELPDGKLTARTDRTDESDLDDVAVTARVEEQGKVLELEDHTKLDGSKKVAGFEVGRRSDENAGSRALDDSETNDLPTAKVAEVRTPEATSAPARFAQRSSTPPDARAVELPTLAPKRDTSHTQTPRPQGSSRTTPPASDPSRAADPLPSSAVVNRLTLPRLPGTPDTAGPTPATAPPGPTVGATPPAAPPGIVQANGADTGMGLANPRARPPRPRPSALDR